MYSVYNVRLEAFKFSELFISNVNPFCNNSVVK